MINRYFSLRLAKIHTYKPHESYIYEFLYLKHLNVKFIIMPLATVDFLCASTVWLLFTC